MIASRFFGSGPAVHGVRNRRAYAVGDVHGCLDLLEATLAAVEKDMATDPDVKSYLIFIGDLIDRGPDSAGVVERLRTYKHDNLETVFLMGNHEESFLRILEGESAIFFEWMEYGGRECLESYGIDPATLSKADADYNASLVQKQVPKNHREFLSEFIDTFTFGDYLFVHAGIAPGVSLEDQDIHDLRWIREPFLSARRSHGKIVVHGHTIVPNAEFHGNRIAIDTGAYMSGKLTTLRIQEDTRRLLSVAN